MHRFRHPQPGTLRLEHMRFRHPGHSRYPRRTLSMIGLVLSVLLLAALFYFKIPTVALDFAGIYVVVLVAAIPAVALTGRVGLMAAYTALTVLFGAVVFLTSAPIIRANAYYQMLGTEHQANFHDALPPIDIDQAPLVSEDMALQAMQKRLCHGRENPRHHFYRQFGFIGGTGTDQARGQGGVIVFGQQYAGGGDEQVS